MRLDISQRASLEVTEKKNRKKGTIIFQEDLYLIQRIGYQDMC